MQEAKNFDIIIIGAGAAGLMAALQLGKAGKSVGVLEARDCAGGRIRTIQPDGFSQHIEAGAEFIHGNLPISLGLLDKYKIGYAPTEGEMWHLDGEKPVRGYGGNVEGYDLLDGKLEALEKDMSVAEFLNSHFGDAKYKALRESVSGFVEGFDAADTEKASVFKFREEWSAIQEEQFRVDGGYGRMIDEMVKDCVHLGCKLYLSTVAATVNWRRGSVEIKSAKNEIYTARRLIVTLPLGVLNASGGLGAIQFMPALPEKAKALKAVGYGPVIKVILEFNEAFWYTQLPNVGFIFTRGTIPTWWTQLPNKSAILTGWLAGAKANKNFTTGADELQIMKNALAGLAAVFKLDEQAIQQKLKAWHVSDWRIDPFSRGAYSYAVANGEEFVRELNRPEEDTLYFAGEGLFTGHETGTVEAALASGKIVVERILERR